MKNRYLKFTSLIFLVCFGLTAILPADTPAEPGPKDKNNGGIDYVSIICR